jgi:putative ubiquitin-RnfH superfamily antitoxin RatB of RatAB toxin-antitoxin module
MDRAERLRIELVHSPQAGQVTHLEFEMAAGATLEDALRANGLLDTGLKVGIWGRPAALDTLLRDRDRIELYRPLTVDPKEARRLRYRDPGDKSKRVGPKPRR